MVSQQTHVSWGVSVCVIFLLSSCYLWGAEWNQEFWKISYAYDLNSSIIGEELIYTFVALIYYRNGSCSMYINSKCHLSHIFGIMSVSFNASSKFCMCMLLVTGESGKHIVLPSGCS